MWHLRLDLRSWQRDAVQAWRSHGDRGVAAVVTGGGKTVLAYACILDLTRRRPDVRVVILVPTVALLDQWVVGLVEDLGVSEQEIAVFGGGRKSSKPRRVNVMVMNTGRTLAPVIAQSGATFLIVDECHRVASPSNAQALAGDHVATLGLSATPDRDFDDLFETVVVPALGSVIYRYDYNQARAEGVISPFELVNVEVPMNLDEREAYDQLTRRLVPLLRLHDKGKPVDDTLHRILRQRARISIDVRSRLPTAVRLVETHRRERALAFHEQINAANVLTALLRDRNHRVATYHSGLGPSLRQDNLRLFRRGEIDVLVTCRALDEGIDVPNASVAVIAASTSSTRQRIQRLGRVLRPAPGKSQATVYTLYATEPEAERLRAEAEQLEGAEVIRWMNVQAF